MRKKFWRNLISRITVCIFLIRSRMKITCIFCWSIYLVVSWFNWSKNKSLFKRDPSSNSTWVKSSQLSSIYTVSSIISLIFFCRVKYHLQRFEAWKYTVGCGWSYPFDWFWLFEAVVAIILKSVDQLWHAWLLSTRGDDARLVRWQEVRYLVGGYLDMWDGGRFHSFLENDGIPNPLKRNS